MKVEPSLKSTSGKELLKLKKFMFVMMTLFCSMTVLAENKLALIRDADGFTFVRSGAGKEFPVVDTLFSDDFFYFNESDDSQWAKIIAWKGRQVEGFMHTSRIQLAKELKLKIQKEIITKILSQHQTLANEFQSAYNTSDSVLYRTAARQKGYYSDTKYDPVLMMLPNYFCTTGDKAVLRLFVATMWADAGSANEMPSYAIGECYVCHPDLIMKQLNTIQNGWQLESLCDAIEWGIINYFEIEEGVKSNNQEYLQLKAQLDTVRKKVPTE